MPSAVDRYAWPLGLEEAEPAVPVAAMAAMAMEKPLGAALVGFSMQPQCHTNWCWAAVAASVARFFDAASPWTQCKVADKDLGRTDCCNFQCHAPNVPSAINRQNSLGSPLNRVRCLARTSASIASRAALTTELAAGRPVGARTEWEGGGSHFVMITGYSGATGTLRIEDSFAGPSDVDYETFCTSYTISSGQWTDSYFTKSPV